MSEEARYQWLMRHIKTCRTCEWRNEDDSSKLCGLADLHFRIGESLDPPPAAVEVKRAGGIELPGFDEVAAKPAERGGYPG